MDAVLELRARQGQAADSRSTALLSALSCRSAPLAVPPLTSAVSLLSCAVLPGLCG